MKDKWPFYKPERKDWTHVIFYSGGLCSYFSAKRVIEVYGNQNVVLLFADTKIEHPTLYAFIEETSKYLNVKLIRICRGLTPWELFKEVRMVGNSRIAPCSLTLKRDLSYNYLYDNYDPSSTCLYYGFDYEEIERLNRIRLKILDWRTEAPMIYQPWISKVRMIELLAKDGIELPELYKLGFAHNNCGGFCVKAGIGHFVQLWQKLPDVYLHHEEEEEKMRKFLGKDVSVLKDRRGGQVRPLTLRQLRAEINEDAVTDEDRHDIGGCNCFTEV